MTIEEYANNFLELLRYVKYVRGERVKIQHFLSGLPQSYKDRIEFDEPQTLDNTIRKTGYCYDQAKSKPDFHKAWKEKKNEKFDQRKKGFNSHHFRNQPRKLPQVVTNTYRMIGDNPRDPT